jgi:hypothetical protein
MSDHETCVVPHDYSNCHTARHAEGQDCGTRYEARCSCGWAQGARNRAAADAIAVGHLVLALRAAQFVVGARARALRDVDRVTARVLRLRRHEPRVSPRQA